MNFLLNGWPKLMTVPPNQALDPYRPPTASFRLPTAPIKVSKLASITGEVSESARTRNKALIYHHVTSSRIP